MHGSIHNLIGGQDCFSEMEICMCQSKYAAHGFAMLSAREVLGHAPPRIYFFS